MAALARYGGVQPTEFDEMTPVDARALRHALNELIDAEWKGYHHLAKVARGSGVRLA